MDQRKTIVVLVAILGLAIVIGIAAFFATPSSNLPLDTNVPIAPIDTTSPTTTDTTTDTTTSSTGAFDLNVLQRAGYKSLDLRPIQDGLLPIKPPAATGKANPFL